MQSELLSSVSKLAYAAAAAAVIGGGATVLNTAERTSVLESRINEKEAQLNRIEAKLDRLIESASYPSTRDRNP